MFSQWNKNVSTTSATGSLDLVTPIAGVASVSLDSIASTQAVYVTPSGTSGLVKGIEKGKLRSLVNMKTGTGNGCGFGFVIVASAETIVTTAGAYYRYELFSSGSYSLARSNSSILTTGSPGTTLNSGSTTIVQNTTYSMEIEWIVDSVNLGGNHLTIRKGTAIDFSNMVLLSQFLDLGAQILTAGNSEGIYLRGYTSVGPVKVLFDSTQLYELVEV